MPSGTAAKSFEYACFICYKHPPSSDVAPSVKHYYLEFVEALQEKLEAFLTTKIRSYRDDQLKSVPGITYPEELSRKLCKSVCLVAVLVPEYLESSWCLAEWKAMEKLEEKRLGPNKKGLIIPVLFRGNFQKAEQFAGTRVIVNFKTVNKPRTQLDTVKNRGVIEDIARRIHALAKQLTSPGEICENFEIDTDVEIITPTHDDPDPLAQ